MPTVSFLAADSGRFEFTYLQASLASTCALPYICFWIGTQALQASFGS